MVTASDIDARLLDQQMTVSTAADSIAAASGQPMNQVWLTQLRHYKREIPDWLTLDMIDWKHLPERIAESRRYRNADVARD